MLHGLFHILWRQIKDGWMITGKHCEKEKMFISLSCLLSSMEPSRCRVFISSLLLDGDQSQGGSLVTKSWSMMNLCHTFTSYKHIYLPDVPHQKIKNDSWKTDLEKTSKLQASCGDDVWNVFVKFKRLLFPLKLSDVHQWATTPFIFHFESFYFILLIDVTWFPTGSRSIHTTATDPRDELLIKD